MEPKRKIIFLITKGFWGGAGRYVFDLATSLPPDQFEVLVALGEPGELGARLETANIRTVGIPHLGRDISLFNDLRVGWWLFNFFRREQPDIIHLNSSKAAGLAALAGRLALVPRIIFTAHGWAFNEPRPNWQKIILKFFHWLTITFCHQTIVVAQATLEQVEDWPFIQNKLMVIHNGLAEPKFYSQTEARKKLLPGLPTETIWLGAIAELHRNKSLDTLVEAFARLAPDYPNLNLLIIGEGEERERLAMQIARHHLTDKIYLLGRVPEAARYLKAFDIFVLPSRTEALPYAVLEAGFAALPVVATRVGGVPEIIKNGETGLLVPPTDSKALASTLKTLLPERYRESVLGKHLRDFVKKNFSRPQMLEKTYTLYQK